jgi:hypothetical protein
MINLTAAQETALIAISEDPAAKVNARTRGALEKRGMSDHNGITEAGREWLAETMAGDVAAYDEAKAEDDGMPVGDRRGVYPFAYPAKPKYAKN